MSVQQVLSDIAERGLSITAAGADLKLQGPRDRIDAELVGRIKSVKAELIEYLQLIQDEQLHSFELTLLQRGYLIGRGGSVELGNVASHVYHEIAGDWDLDRLQAALRSVVARHGMLRTRFTDDGRQVCAALPDGFGIGRIDLTGLAEAAQAERLAELREQRSHRVLPADRAPMLAVEAVLLGGDDPQRRMRLLVGHDGLVMDGISMFLFFRQWWDAYSSTADSASAAEVAAANEAPTGEAADAEASFADYIATLERARQQAPYQRSRTYWLDRIEDLAPCPDLALRASPASISQPRFSQHVARLDASAWALLKARAATAGLTPTSLLVAGYAELLSRWGGGSAFTLNSTLANRPPIHPRILSAIGNFSETMLIEIELDRRLSFTQRAQTLQARLRRDLDNRHFSGIEVLRELGRQQGADRARMPYTFNSTIGYVDATLDGSTLELFGPELYTSSQTPQVWLNGFAFEQHGGLVVQFDSVDGLFPDGMIEAMVAGYQRLLDELAAEDGERAALSWTATTFDLLPEEQRRCRAEVNDTGVALAEVGLEQAFLDQVARDPDALAVIGSQASLSYRELLAQAGQAAAWLRAQQVGRDELVGLVMTRGPEQVIGIMACVLAGAAYLPIEAGLPLERQHYMLRDGRVRCVLTNVENFQAPEAILARPARSAIIDDLPLPSPLPGAGLDDLAYVLYTSGTTGEPKGVMVSRRSVANVVADCQRRFAICPSDRLFGISAFNFDLSVWDVFGALSAGAAIVLPDHGRAADPAHWLQLCEQAGVSVWNSVPAIVALLHDEVTSSGRLSALAALRLVMMSGDRIPPELPGLLHAMKPELAVVSLGGPTETT
ncbi:MAG: AMP-binding protein, partial [Jatrophihabitantaceae bacterium]